MGPPLPPPNSMGPGFPPPCAPYQDPIQQQQQQQQMNLERNGGFDANGAKFNFNNNNNNNNNNFSQHNGGFSQRMNVDSPDLSPISESGRDFRHHQERGSSDKRREWSKDGKLTKEEQEESISGMLTNFSKALGDIREIREKRMQSQ